MCPFFRLFPKCLFLRLLSCHKKWDVGDLDLFVHPANLGFCCGILSRGNRELSSVPSRYDQLLIIPNNVGYAREKLGDRGLLMGKW